jgi:4-methyl-5(b-hydroxyethyl)-thiazole monophosphate biosynthesis
MFKQSTDTRVAAFFANGLEECEGLVVTDLLYRMGIPCDIVSIVPQKTITSSHEVTITCDRSIADEGFSFDDYDVLFLPGGMPGTKNLRACEPLCDAVTRAVSQGKVVAAVCAAPSILAELGLLKGRRATANPGFQELVAEHGATVLQDSVVEDGTIVTSKGLGTSIELGLALVRRILGPQAEEEAKGKIVYNG